MEENKVVIEIGEIIGSEKKCVWIGEGGAWVNLTEDGISRLSAEEMAIRIAHVVEDFTVGKVPINFG